MAETRSNRRGACHIYFSSRRGRADRNLFRKEISLPAFPFSAFSPTHKDLGRNAADRCAGRGGVLTALCLHCARLRDHPRLWARGSGGFWSRRVCDAGLFSAGRGAQLCRVACCRTELRRSSRRASRHSVYSAIGIASLMMLVLTLIAFLAPATLIRIFSRDPRVIAFGSEYLRIVSLNFISAGIVFTTSSVFQGIGNTLPPLFSSLTRLVLFAVPALIISRMPGFEIREIWYLSVGSIIFQMCINLLLLRHELRKRLRFDEPEDLFLRARRRSLSAIQLRL